jgi:hypothetical protein
MDFTDDAVRMLARQVYGEGARRFDREALEADLVPMIRVALRSGRGQPLLVRWVKQNLPGLSLASHLGDKIDPEWAAPRMARLLCAQMLEHVRAECARMGGRETLVGL